MKFLLRRCLLLTVLLLSACAGAPKNDASELAPLPIPPIRFVLTFDDGPSHAAHDNPTATILDALKNNPVQAGIKAVFFVQTFGTMQGPAHALLLREHAEGHVLGFHTATDGHANHRRLEPAVLEASLHSGRRAIAAISGEAPRLIRPPFWNYDERTFAAYRTHGLHMLLTDLSANDGKIRGINISLRRRSNLLAQLDQLRTRIQAGELSATDGAIPVVVTFHDINTFTANHMREYLQILVDAAAELRMPTTTRPFYDEREALQRAALARTVVQGSQAVRLPGLWGWIWQ